MAKTVLTNFEDPMAHSRVQSYVDAEEEKKKFLSHKNIAMRAYQIWQAEGCADGRDKDHWIQAELELKTIFNAGKK